MKQLPNKWKEHIRKMVEYSQKANKLRQELDIYLVEKGFVDDDIYETTIFEDSIVDVMEHTGEWENLIQEIENGMNGIRDEENEKYIQERMKMNNKL